MKTPTHTHRESVKPTLPDLGDLVGPEDGFFIVPATIDAEAGEEMVFVLRDQAPSIERLWQLRSFQLNSRSGVHFTFFGPVAWFLFWASEEDDPDTAAASFLKCFHPHDEKALASWRRLVDQDHWHLFLVVGNEMREYITFCDLRLDEKLDFVVEKRGAAVKGYPAEAEKAFRNQYSNEDLLNMSDGHHRNHLSLDKSGLEHLSEEDIVETILDPKSSGPRVRVKVKERSRGGRVRR